MSEEKKISPKAVDGDQPEMSKEEIIDRIIAANITPDAQASDGADILMKFAEKLFHGRENDE